MKTKYVVIIDKYNTKVVVSLEGIRFVSNPPINEKVSTRCVKIEYTDGAEGVILTKNRENSEQIVEQLLNILSEE
jgi:hypothetical protein